jgi:hypothetical protein
MQQRHLEPPSETMRKTFSMLLQIPCQEQSKPLIEDFEVWLKTQRSGISAKSRLGE